MGPPEDYRLPPRDNDAYHLVGDGVLGPAAPFLGEALLTPLLAAQDAVAPAPAQ